MLNFLMETMSILKTNFLYVTSAISFYNFWIFIFFIHFIILIFFYKFKKKINIYIILLINFFFFLIYFIIFIKSFIISIIKKYTYYKLYKFFLIIFLNLVFIYLFFLFINFFVFKKIINYKKVFDIITKDNFSVKFFGINYDPVLTMSSNFIVLWLKFIVFILELLMLSFIRNNYFIFQDLKKKKFNFIFFRFCKYIIIYTTVPIFYLLIYYSFKFICKINFINFITLQKYYDYCFIRNYLF